MSADRPSLRRIAALAALALLATGCSWFTDFKDQPKIEPWEAEMAGNDTTPFRGSPEFSVPITGVVEPAYVVSHAQMPATIDSMSGLVNPHRPTPESLDNGRKYYQINCAVCHGAAGAGNGTAVRYGVPAPNLLTDITKNRTDGYIFGMIRNGRGLMPTYDRIEDMDRWDVVNYVRALQGKIPGVTADTSPAGYPGQNGRMVPGATLTAPTRPAPYRPEDMARRMAGADTTGAAAAPAAADTTHAAPRAAAPKGARP
ncbi:MAG TPA: cytochrome c [Gemmatimonadaceae bacterium]|nr:cytochrome c [Gemmatimonadaceae bacterium]